MNLIDLVSHYVAFRRTLGEKCHTSEQTLRSFCRAVGARTPVTRVRPDAVSAFLAGAGPLTRTWHAKYHALKGFFRFAVSRGHLPEAPLPAVVPKRPDSFAPYIYSRDDLRRLLGAIPSCRRPAARIEPSTLRAIVLVLYGAGLRTGEALGLSVADVDCANALLTVRDTKFFKSRLVPVGPQLAGALTDYARWRAGARPPAVSGGRFFVGAGGAAIRRSTLGGSFRRLRERAEVRRRDGGRPPRLHDLRHTFAVHRLTAWYRQGADVNRLLPHLSVYLGHAQLAATQVYLSMTPELLQLASARFERYALGEDSHA